MNLLLLLVKIIHILLILFVIIVPFTNNIKLLCFYSIFVPLMILHWFTLDICFLGILESWISGKTYNDTFINRILIGPVYRVKSNLITTVTVILLFICFYKVIKNKDQIKFKVFK